MDRATIKRVAIRLNGGSIRGSSKALAQAMGVSVKTARAWMLDPKERNHRAMSPTAKRLLAILVLLESTHKLSEEFLEAVDVTERLLATGDLVQNG